MTYLLRIDVSPRACVSHSRRFANEAMARLLALHNIERVVHRDIASDPVPPIEETYVRAMLAHTSREASIAVSALAFSEKLIDELDAACALLISTPVHNYTVPAALKLWIDHIVRVGRTFKSTPTGKVGTLFDRPTLIVSAAGGYFRNGAAAQPDFFTPYVNAVLATIGIYSVRHIRLEGLARGDEAVCRAYANAREELSLLRTA
ncbi:MAG: FMN-dependent NADH-azoreductase [Hyphomicrobiaceae bacterium]